MSIDVQTKRILLVEGNRHQEEAVRQVMYGDEILSMRFLDELDFVPVISYAWDMKEFAGEIDRKLAETEIPIVSSETPEGIRAEQKDWQGAFHALKGEMDRMQAPDYAGGR